MKKKLSVLMVALVAIAAFAVQQTRRVAVTDTEESVTFDFTTNDWGFPTEAKAIDEASFTAGDYTIKVAGSTGNGYRWYPEAEENDPYLLFGQSGAYIELPAFTSAVKVIKVVGRSGASASTGQNIFVNGTAVSTATVGAQGTNFYRIPEASQAAGTIYRLQVTTAHNSQVKQIVVYKNAPTEYEITAATGIEHGTVAFSPAKAFAGETVTVTATPDDGYFLANAGIIVKDAENNNVVVSGNKFVMPEGGATVSAIFAQPEDITIAAADIADGNITAALTTAIAGKVAKNITINLAANGEYTVSAPIESSAGLTIAGPAELGNGKAPVIDASANTGSFVRMATPVVAANAKNFYEVDNFAIKNVVVKNIKSYVYDDNKNAFAFAEFAIENCVFEFNNTKQDIDCPFRFQAGGPVKFVLKNNTMYQKGTKNNKYFVKINSGNFPDKAFATFDGPYVWDIENNTFYQTIAHGGDSKMEFLNGGRVSNNFAKTSITILKNIIVDCAGSDSFLKNLFGGKSSDGDREKFVAINTDYNTYWTDGAAIDLSKYDKGENTIAADPQFKDAANGDFALALTGAQNVAKTGDPRWIQYSVTIADGIENGSVVADLATAKAGDVVTLTATPADGYMLDKWDVKQGETAVAVKDNKFTMPAGDVTVGATFRVAPVDVEIAATDITEGKLTDAIVAKAAGKPIKNLTVTLAENTAYTVTASIEVSGNVTINGAAGAKIDASGLEGDFITLNGSTEFVKKADETDSDHYGIDAVAINGVTINGLKGALITDAQKTLVKELTVANSVVEMPAAGKNVLNFNGKGYAGKVVVKNSTIYANGNNTGFFAQYGSRPKNINGDWLQEFDVQNSTIVNIAVGKNVCDLKQNGTAQNVFTLKNNVFVNVGKSGQVVVGFNKGQTSATPVWDVDGNVFNYDGADTSAAEVAKAGKKNDENIVKNSVAGIVAFTNAAEGDFSGNCQLAPDVTVPTAAVGDPRWTIMYKESPIKTLWKSAEAVALSWGTGVDVEKANTDIIQVGDVIHVAVEGVTASDNAWSAQVALYDQQWTQLENGTPVGTGTVTDAAIVVTGDMLALIKANGLKIAGDGYSTKQVTVERGVYMGSEKSIWVGDATLTWTQAEATKFHFINTNVTAGQIIKLTYEATGNPNIQFRYGWGSEDVYGAPTYGEGFATVAVSAEAVDILKDKGLIINADGIRLTQMELLPAPPVDITISPAEGDIAAALKAETDKVATVGKITINLTEKVTYTVGATLIAPYGITINGNGATIDASALEANLIEFAAKAAEDTEWTNANVSISGVTVKGLKKALFYSNSKYYYGDFSLINSVVEQAADATTFDYTKGSVAVNFTVTGSTIYAPTATTKSLYSSQGGQKATEYSADATQSFAFLLNTMYNLAKGKNFFTHRQSNQKWLAYGVHSNIFVNCGKSGQVIKGMNGGQSGANPTWVISGNAFNFDGADTSADESTGDDEEPVKESVAGVMTFANVETPDFGGTFEMPAGATAPTGLGDIRWTITFTNAATGIQTVKAENLENATIYTIGGQRVEKAQKGLYIINGKKVVVK